MPNSALIQNLAIPPNLSIYEATEVLNRAHRRIVVIVEEDMTLLGVVTDSNIRQSVLDRIDMEEPVSRIMRARPVVAFQGQDDDQILNLMETTTCYQIPVVDDQNKLVDIRFLEEVSKSKQEFKETVAVLMVGGEGKRLRPLTEETPKPLLQVGDKPLLFSIMDHLIESGVDRLYLAVNYHAEMIRDAIASQVPYASRLSFVEEDEPMGTAGALSLIKERPTGPFIIMNGDLLTKAAISEMLKFHRHERNVLTVALREESREVPFGVARVEGTRILSVTEKPSHTYFVNAGIYVAEPYILDRIPANTRYDMTTLIEDLISNDLRVGSFPVHEYWTDIGTPEQLEQARQDADFVLKPRVGR